MLARLKGGVEIENMNRVLAEWDKFASVLASHEMLSIVDRKVG